MSNNRFTVKEIAERLEAEIWFQGVVVSGVSTKETFAEAGIAVEVIEQHLLSGLATLQSAGTDQLSFLANPKYAPQLKTTQAGAVLLTAQAALDYQGIAIVVANPYLSYATLSHHFAPRRDTSPGVHETAVVDETAHIHESAQIGPGAVVGAQTQIHAHASVGAGCVIGEHCVVGVNSRLAPRVTLYRDVHIGADCLIHSGAVIGADGFGFAPTPNGWQKIAQLGGVCIGDRVEIGANTCIDRGALEDTVVESGVIIDNQVQIAHNCQIGEGTAIAGCVGIAGSTKIGPKCTLAGQAGLAGHITLVGGTHVGMQAQVTRSITEPGQYSSGTGLWPQRQWRRLVARWRRNAG